MFQHRFRNILAWLTAAFAMENITKRKVVIEAVEARDESVMKAFCVS